MLNHPTLDRLRELGLDGMAKGFCDLTANPESRALEHAEWLGLLVEQEATLRQQKRFEARTRTAKLRHAASIEDVDFRTPRGLDRALFLRLASGDWIREHRHCLITGPCGTGKSWLACALGDKACRDNFSVLYQRSSRLFASLALARGDGRYARLMRQLARVDLLILDDWGPEPLAAEQRRYLLEEVGDDFVLRLLGHVRRHAVAPVGGETVGCHFDLAQFLAQRDRVFFSRVGEHFEQVLAVRDDAIFEFLLHVILLIFRESVHRVSPRNTGTCERHEDRLRAPCR